ncbi:hypothetical protein OG994_03895 [Micromonospora globbae]|uniref:Uncharacterized protein n=1 Tax=Micromonospora globbae TaxID=1894969 RepID=A0ABZ1S8G6_9ACTN|nr:hypothetical protein [Micromonospora globbae]
MLLVSVVIFAVEVVGAVITGLQTCLAGHFDVDYSAFQLEPASHADHEHPTHP